MRMSSRSPPARGPTSSRRSWRGARPTGAQSRSPEARLEEAVGLAGAIDLDVVGSGLVSLIADPPLDLSRKGQGRGDRRPRRGRGDHARPDGLRIVPRAAAQPGKGLERQGDRPHRADPGDLRPARPHARKARSRSSSPISTTRRGGSSAPGPISSVSAAAAAFWAALARRRSSPIAASCRTASSRSSATSIR